MKTVKFNNRPVVENWNRRLECLKPDRLLANQIFVFPKTTEIPEKSECDRLGSSWIPYVHTYSLLEEI